MVDFGEKLFLEASAHCKNKVVGFDPHKVTSVAAPVYQRMLSYWRAVQ